MLQKTLAKARRRSLRSIQIVLAEQFIERAKKRVAGADDKIWRATELEKAAPENSKRAHCRAPTLQTPPNSTKGPQERERRMKIVAGGGEKKERNFGPHPSGLHPSGLHPSGSTLRGSTLRGSTLRGSTLRGSTLRGSTLRGSTFLGSTLLGSTLLGSTLLGSTLLGSLGSPPFGAPLFLGLGLHPSGPHPSRAPRPKIQHPKIGRSRNWPKSIALVTDRGAPSQSYAAYPTDAQSVWLLLFHCTSARATYFLRVASPDAVLEYASLHDLCQLLDISPTLCDNVAKQCATLLVLVVWG